MTITYNDNMGYIAVIVNEYGITFDQDKSIAIFEDESGKEYRIPITSIHQITAI